MTPYLMKWLQTIKVCWTKYTTYRLNFLLQVLGPALVFFFIKYQLWSAIFETPQAGGSSSAVTIGAYDLSGMITYHGFALVVGLLTQGHAAMNLAEDIRMGRISTYLIYPFNFWEFHTANFIAFELLQILVTGVTLFCFSLTGLVPLPPWEIILSGYLFCLVVSCFWFSLQFFTGLLGFWLEETWILRVMLQLLSTFLSGAIIPIDLFPEWAQKILDFTPFPYLTYYPIKLFTTGDISIANGLAMIIGWTLIFVFINRKIWQRGIKLYTAAGM